MAYFIDFALRTSITESKIKSESKKDRCLGSFEQKSTISAALSYKKTCRKKCFGVDRGPLPLKVRGGKIVP